MAKRLDDEEDYGLSGYAPEQYQEPIAVAQPMPDQVALNMGNGRRDVLPEEDVVAPPQGNPGWFHDAFTSASRFSPGLNIRQAPQNNFSGFAPRIDPTKTPLSPQEFNRTGKANLDVSLPDVSGLTGEKRVLPNNPSDFHQLDDLDKWNKLHNDAKFDPEARRTLDNFRNFNKAEYQQMGAAAEQRFKEKQAEAQQKAILERQRELIGVRGDAKVDAHGKMLDQNQQKELGDLERKKAAINLSFDQEIASERAGQNDPAKIEFYEKQRREQLLEVDTHIKGVTSRKGFTPEFSHTDHEGQTRKKGEIWRDKEGLMWTVNHAGDQVPVVHPGSKPPKDDHHEEKTLMTDYAEAMKALTHDVADAQGNLRKVYPTQEEVIGYIRNKRAVMQEFLGGGSKQAPAPAPQPQAQPLPVPASKLPQVNSPQDLARIPSGAVFIGPDGKQRVKH